MRRTEKFNHEQENRLDRFQDKQVVCFSLVINNGVFFHLWQLYVLSNWVSLPFHNITINCVNDIEALTPVIVSWSCCLMLKKKNLYVVHFSSSPHLLLQLILEPFVLSLCRHRSWGHCREHCSLLILIVPFTRSYTITYVPINSPWAVTKHNTRSRLCCRGCSWLVHDLHCNLQDVACQWH